MNYKSELLKLADTLDVAGHIKVAAMVDGLIVKIAEDEKQGIIAKIKDMFLSGTKSIEDWMESNYDKLAKMVVGKPELLKTVTELASGKTEVLGELLSGLSLEDLLLFLI